MSDDLRRALDDLAARTTAEHTAQTRAGHGLPIADMTSRAGRRRRRHAAVVSATVLTTVLAVGAAGIALADWRIGEPLPATTPSITYSPTPTPTPTPTQTQAPVPDVVLPTGDASLPFGECGSLITAAPRYPVDSRFALEVSLDSTTIKSGDPLVARSSLRTDAAMGVEYVATPAAGPQYAIVKDGTVVATTAPEGSADLGYTGDASLDFHGPIIVDRLPLAVCGPTGQPEVTAGWSLPAGTYELHPWSEPVDVPHHYDYDDPGPATSSPAPPLSLDETIKQLGVHLTALGPVTTFVVQGDATPPAASPDSGAPVTVGSAVPEPTCGGPAPVVDTTGPLRTTTPMSGARLVTADLPHLSSTFTYRGPGRLRGEFGYVWLWLVQDGKVVGTDMLPTDRADFFALGHDLSWPVEGLPLDPDSKFVDCTDLFARQPVPPGEYQAYVGSRLLVETYEMPDGSTTDGEQETWSFAAPFTLVVG